jgi:hypothetical protein
VMNDIVHQVSVYLDDDLGRKQVKPGGCHGRGKMNCVRE